MDAADERSPTGAELLTEQFYRWESRGRGWMVWPDPVELEPPFRPFEGHYLPHKFYRDDGAQETTGSRLAGRVLGLLGVKQAPSIPTDSTDGIEEPRPDYLGEREELVEFQVALPADYQPSGKVFEQCLASLAYCRGALSFEVVGTKDELVAQVVAEAGDARRVGSQLKAHFPEAVLDSAEGYLRNHWFEAEERENEKRDAEKHEDKELFKEILEFGLNQEFMLGLKSTRELATDPLVSICAALDTLEVGETGIFQLLFQPVRQRWGESALRAVTADDGTSFLENVPDLVNQTKEKLSRPLFGVVVRVAAKSPNNERVWEIIRALGGALTLFANPNGNELVPLENEDYLDDAHEVDLLNRCSHRSGMLLNSDELVSLAHLPTAAVRSHKLRREVKRTKAAPAIAKVGGIVLGENLHEGEATPVRLTGEQRTQHTYVIGVSGTGKSTFLANLIAQDIQNGDGVAVLDPHGDLVDAVLSRVPPERFADVVLFDPADQEFPVGFNILSAHSELERNLLEGDLVAVFQRLSTSWGDQMTAVLANAIAAFLESSQGGTIADLRRFLLEDNFRREFLRTVQDSEIVYYWKKQFPLLAGKPQASVVTRLDSFLRPKAIRYMVCQKESRLDFAEIMNRGKIFLAKLPQGLIGEENSYLLGTFLVAKFHQMAIGRQSIEASKRRNFWLYIDEFHNFITPSMASILSGARKYRLGLVLAHQELGQLKNRQSEVGSAVLANPYTRVCFRLGDEDARKLAEGFSAFETRDLQNLGIGEAICRVERREFDFNLHVTPLPAVPESDAETAGTEIRRLSREAYATPKEKVAEELAKLWTMPDEDTTEPEKRQTRSKRKPDSDEPPPDSAPPDSPPTPPTPSSPPSSPAPVSPAAPSAAAAEPSSKETTPPSSPPIPKLPATPGRGGAEHKGLVHFIKLVAEALGWRYENEAPIPGGWADLLLERDGERIGIQVSISNQAPSEVEGLKKCLAAGFKHVLMVCDEPKKLKMIQAAAAESLTESEIQSVTWLLKDDVPKFLKAKGGTAAPGMVAGRRVTIKQSGTLEDSAKAAEQINKAAAKAMTKRKKKKGSG